MQVENEENPFQAVTKLYHVEFETRYKNIVLLDLIFEEEAIATSAYELKSETVDARPEDLWCYVCYYSEEVDKEYILSKVGFFIEDDVRIYEEQPEDWVSKVHSQARPIEAGKFFVGNSSLINKCPNNLIPIEINAGRAFGTGEHQTTSLCLELISEIQGSPINIIDIGTGTGILAIASKKLYKHSNVYGTDIDPVAIEVARENSLINKQEIDYSENISDFYEVEKFDLVIANILANPLIEMSEQVSKIIKPEGWIILSGFIKNQVNDLIVAYEKLSFKVEKIVYKDDWAALQFIKKY